MTHYYEKNIVEIKNEYTTFIINIMTPLMYEGIKAIYEKSKNLEEKFIEKEKNDSKTKNPGIFKIFQLFLKDVPNLNSYSIESETNRIKEKSKCSEYFDDLVKAVIKSNIVLLTYNASGKTCKLVNEKFHETIDTKNFVHKCYVECARLFYNNPELFWHKYSNIEIKKNQKESYDLIKTAIGEAIRKMLPVKLILDEYLKNDYIIEEKEEKYQDVQQMINRDIYSEHEYNADPNKKIVMSEENIDVMAKLPESKIIDEQNDDDEINAIIEKPNEDDLDQKINYLTSEAKATEGGGIDDIILNSDAGSNQKLDDKTNQTNVKNVYLNMDDRRSSKMDFFKDEIKQYKDNFNKAENNEQSEIKQNVFVKQETLSLEKPNNNINIGSMKPKINKEEYYSNMMR
jgi:hypothetical protein